jgi:hypothetical protein
LSRLFSCVFAADRRSKRIATVFITATCLIAGSFLQGCLPGTSVSYGIKLPGDSAHCWGLMESQSRLSLNGSGVIRPFATSDALPPRLANAEYHRLDWKEENFEPQTDANLCWAATLSMAFRLGGYRYGQEVFLKANRDVCGGFGSTSASLNQMIHALGTVHYKKGEWITERGMFGTFSSAIEWFRSNPDGSRFVGGIYPFTHTNDLLVAMMVEKEPVVIGYLDGGSPHVVLVVGVHARVGGKQIGNNIIPDYFDARIDGVQIIDPQKTGKSIYMDYNYLVENSRFAFRLRA